MPFFSTTALGPDNPAFRGRTADLEQLLRLCHDDVSTYWVIYGGRQNGKTSLLLQLAAALANPVHVCYVDFQDVSDESIASTFGYLAEEISKVLPAAEPPTCGNATTLRSYLSRVLAMPQITRLVLLLDELGALPADVRTKLGLALRSLFHARLRDQPLAKLLVIFSGGIELYDMVHKEASSLHNVCKPLDLADLAEHSACDLIADGLRTAGVDDKQARVLGQATYKRVQGHPYLTQHIGEYLTEIHLRGETLTHEHVQQAEIAIHTSGASLLRRIRADLREHHLEDAARLLLTNPPNFTRLDESMARLELIGLAKPDGTRWAPRNPLLADIFHDLLNVQAPSSSTPQPAPPTPTPSDEQAAIITAKRRLLAENELLAARFGIHCPPHITIEIEDLRREIAQLTKEQPPSLPATKPAEQSPTPKPIIAPSPIQPQPAWIPELVHIPAGPFLMGSRNDDKLADEDEKPQHRLLLPDFWIGKTPVTNAQFRLFVESDGYTNPAYWTSVGWQWREQKHIITPGFWGDAKWNGDNHPVVGVSWFEAVAYCRWLSALTKHAFRLPTEAEWEKAARGPDGWMWPWGNTWNSGRCNNKKEGPGGTTPVGQYPSGASPYRMLDMAGNVYEWCATQWGKSYPYQIEEEWSDEYLDSGRGRVLRGGCWFGERKHMRGAYRIYDYDPRYRNDHRGLRVATSTPLLAPHS